MCAFKLEGASHRAELTQLLSFLSKLISKSFSPINVNTGFSKLISEMVM